MLIKISSSSGQKALWLRWDAILQFCGLKFCYLTQCKSFDTTSGKAAARTACSVKT